MLFWQNLQLILDRLNPYTMGKRKKTELNEFYVYIFILCGFVSEDRICVCVYVCVCVSVCLCVCVCVCVCIYTHCSSQWVPADCKNEGKVESSQPSLRETRDKRPLGRDTDMRWCQRHTTSMIKLIWPQPMFPWASAAEYEQGEKLSA